MKGSNRMNIYEALNKLSPKKKEYFLWKFNLYVFNDATQISEEELCKKLEVKSLAYMHKWEKSHEFQILVNLWIESQVANDLEQIYRVTRDKAITGDEKAIKLLLELQKQVKAFNKEVKSINKVADSNPLDELEL